MCLILANAEMRINGSILTMTIQFNISVFAKN